jgi:phage baseplate assembly protein W
MNPVQGDPRPFLGRGWSHPIRPSANGRDVELSAHEDNVGEALRIILETEPGSRVMLPDFGAGLGRFVFSPNTPTTHALVRRATELALVRWEPRIDVVRVAVGSPSEKPERIDIEVQYRVRVTNTFYNLVFPFYLLEAQR